MSTTSSWRDDPGWPDVDVVMPIRNEEAHLETALASVRAQDYPGPLRIFLGVGPSEDATEEVANRLAVASDDLTVVANPSGTIPDGLNLAIDAGSAPIVVRVDGHSELSDGYIERAVRTLRRSRASNVGGRQVPVGSTPFERSVAAATTSWLGTGGASYRIGGDEGPTDTVYLGVYDRAALASVGGYDPALLANEDYELNIRLRKSGHLVWFDPELSVRYRPRGSWGALVRQYHGYGRWKAEVARRHPESLRFRQVLPPVAVGGAVLGAVVGLRRPLALAVPTAYLTLLAVASRGRLRVAAIAAAVHGCWSAGLVRGLCSAARTER